MSRSYHLLVRTLVVIFSFATILTLQSWAGSGKVLYSFTGKNDGASPYGPLVFDSAGNLYGTTYAGGTSGQGTVFKLSLANGKWTETVIHNFAGYPNDGGGPESGLVFDAAGNIYGTTWTGGKNAAGTVYKLARQSNGTYKQNILYNFNCCDGSDGAQNPSQGVYLDGNNTIYGVTQYGGNVILCYDDEVGCGTFYKLTRDSSGWHETVLYNFAQTPDGALPWGPLVRDKTGNFYGASLFGGSSDYSGTVFKLAPGSKGEWTESVVYTDDTDSGEGVMGVALDNAGNLYAVGSPGVTELTPNSSGGFTPTRIYSFGNPPSPGNPYSGVVISKSGVLYGTTAWGGGGSKLSCGGNGCGTVYQVKETSGQWSGSVVYNFLNSAKGDGPQAPVILDSKGNLYGTTAGGGAYGYGAVYEVTP